MKVEKAQFKSNKCGVTQSNCSLPPTDYSSKGGTLRLYVFILMIVNSLFIHSFFVLTGHWGIENGRKK